MIIHPNKKQFFSSVTFFFWTNCDCEEVILLRGKFSGVFKLKTRHSLSISTHTDSITSSGFTQLTRFFEAPDSIIKRIYPHFRSFCVEVERGEEVVEVVEKIEFTDDFLLEEHKQSVFKCSLSCNMDPRDSDLIVKTFFFGRFFSTVWDNSDGNRSFFVFR